jgi:hypothetical protein
MSSQFIMNLLSHGRLFAHYLCAAKPLHCILRNRHCTLERFLTPTSQGYDYLLAVSNGADALTDEALLRQLVAMDVVQYACQFDPSPFPKI